MGKSRLLSSPRAAELTSLAPDAEVLFPTQLDEIADLRADSYLHYNLLRPAQRTVKRGQEPAHNFGFDPKWRQVLALPAKRRALVLVAGKEALIERARRRTMNELGGEHAYKHDKWLSLYERIDLGELYASWRAELDRQAIPYIELDAEAEGFPQLQPEG